MPISAVVEFVSTTPSLVTRTALLASAAVVVAEVEGSIVAVAVVEAAVVASMIVAAEVVEVAVAVAEDSRPIVEDSATSLGERLPSRLVKNRTQHAHCSQSRRTATEREKKLIHWGYGVPGFLTCATNRQ